jgi:hypothetical protein
MQFDGNLVLYDEFGAPRWSTDTWRPTQRRGHQATMQVDGNFVLYDVEHSAVWASGTWGQTHSNWFCLAVQEDGNLVIYDTFPDVQDPSAWVAVWSTGTYH